MEAAMGGGASFNTDGDWESICGILSIDQDSDFATILDYNRPHYHLPTSYNHEGLLSTLMDDTTTHYGPITSPFSQFHSQHSLIPNPYISPQLMSCSSTTTSNDDLSYNNNNNSSCSSYLNDSPSHYDQISPLLPSSSSIDGDFPINNGLNARRVTKKARDDQAPLPKKRPRVSKDVAKAKRETKPRKSKVKEVKIQDVEEEEEDDRKSGCNASENDESIASEGLVTRDLNGRKRASRGSATDPQSLYARKRRERINERLKILQTLVPNGTKVDISTMLEEAVNYVNFLQLQIKLLSSDEMWMYAPLAYNGFDVGHSTSFWS